MVESSKSAIINTNGSEATQFEGFSEVRKTIKGRVESADIKANFNL